MTGWNKNLKMHKAFFHDLDKVASTTVIVFCVDLNYLYTLPFVSIVKSSQVTFIYIALLTIQIVTKQLHNIKMGK